MSPVKGRALSVRMPGCRQPGAEIRAVQRSHYWPAQIGAFPYLYGQHVTGGIAERDGQLADLLSIPAAD